MKSSIPNKPTPAPIMPDTDVIRVTRSQMKEAFIAWGTTAGTGEGFRKPRDFSKIKPIELEEYATDSANYLMDLLKSKPSV